MFYAQTKETVGEIRRFLHFGQQTKSPFFADGYGRELRKSRKCAIIERNKDAKGERIW